MNRMESKNNVLMYYVQLLCTLQRHYAQSLNIAILQNLAVSCRYLTTRIVM